jgi:hypothetical protein
MTPIDWKQFHVARFAFKNGCKAETPRGLARWLNNTTAKRCLARLNGMTTHQMRPAETQKPWKDPRRESFGLKDRELVWRMEEEALKRRGERRRVIHFRYPSTDRLMDKPIILTSIKRRGRYTSNENQLHYYSEIITYRSQRAVEIRDYGTLNGKTVTLVAPKGYALLVGGTADELVDCIYIRSNTGLPIGSLDGADLKKPNAQDRINELCTKHKLLN